MVKAFDKGWERILNVVMVAILVLGNILIRGHIHQSDFSALNITDVKVVPLLNVILEA